MQSPEFEEGATSDQENEVIVRTKRQSKSLTSIKSSMTMTAKPPKPMTMAAQKKWKHSAAKAADNLARILQEIELDDVDDGPPRKPQDVIHCSNAADKDDGSLKCASSAVLGVRSSSCNTNNARGNKSAGAAAAAAAAPKNSAVNNNNNKGAGTTTAASSAGGGKKLSKAASKGMKQGRMQRLVTERRKKNKPVVGECAADQSQEVVEEKKGESEMADGKEAKDGNGAAPVANPAKSKEEEEEAAPSNNISTQPKRSNPPKKKKRPIKKVTSNAASSLQQDNGIATVNTDELVEQVHRQVEFCDRIIVGGSATLASSEERGSHEDEEYDEYETEVVVDVTIDDTRCGGDDEDGSSDVHSHCSEVVCEVGDEMKLADERAHDVVKQVNEYHECAHDVKQVNESLGTETKHIKKNEKEVVCTTTPVTQTPEQKRKTLAEIRRIDNEKMDEEIRKKEEELELKMKNRTGSPTGPTMEMIGGVECLMEEMKVHDHRACNGGAVTSGSMFLEEKKVEDDADASTESNKKKMEDDLGTSSERNTPSKVQKSKEETTSAKVTEPDEIVEKAEDETTSELRALQDKIRASRANAEALNLSRVMLKDDLEKAPILQAGKEPQPANVVAPAAKDENAQQKYDSKVTQGSPVATMASTAIKNEKEVHEKQQDKNEDDMPKETESNDDAKAVPEDAQLKQAKQKRAATADMTKKAAATPKSKKKKKDTPVDSDLMWQRAMQQAKEEAKAKKKAKKMEKNNASSASTMASGGATVASDTTASTMEGEVNDAVWQRAMQQAKEEAEAKKNKKTVKKKVKKNGAKPKKSEVEGANKLKETETAEYDSTTTKQSKHKKKAEAKKKKKKSAATQKEAPATFNKKAAAPTEESMALVPINQVDEEEAIRIAEKEAIRRAKEEEQKEQMLELVKNVLRHAKNEDVHYDAHYKVLGVTVDASLTDMKKAYRKLALKLHPDKDKYGTLNAEDAFRAVSHAYDTLTDPTRRQVYDQERRNYDDVNINASTSSATGDNGGAGGPTKPAPAISTYETIPTGASITIHSADARYIRLNGVKGTVLGRDVCTGLYTVKLATNCSSNNKILYIGATSLFQNVVVCLRAYLAQELGGVFLVTLVSYWKDRYAGGLSYHARFSSRGGTETTTLRSEHFIVPNGTVVRLEGLQSSAGPNYNGRYGTIVEWVERYDDWSGVDTSYYEIRLSEANSVRVKMAYVCL